jgi:hypothetical protein
MEGYPRIVQRLTDAVGEKLGRPAYCRKVLNQDEWYISDPVFSFVQHGMKKGATGYRVGYRVDLVQRVLFFNLVHSPVIALLFKRNLVFSSLIQVTQATARWRRFHWIYRSSKVALRSGRNGEPLEADSLSDFVALLEKFDHTHGFIRDMFPKRRNTGKGEGQARVAGNTFYLLLADQLKPLHSRAGIGQFVEASWPLFLCLYPIKPIEGRSASLARNMRIRGIPQVCEFPSIQLPEGVAISPLCRGTLQGAHIKPDSSGGSEPCRKRDLVVRVPPSHDGGQALRPAEHWWAGGTVPRWAVAA